MEDSESSAGLKRKDRTKSSAWAHFGVKTTEDGSAVCLYCKRSVVARMVIHRIYFLTFVHNTRQSMN